MNHFDEVIGAGGPVLTDGGIETRIMFGGPVAMEAHVQVAGLAGDPEGRDVLRSIYAGYVEAAKQHDLPVVIGSPTFRASPNFIEAAGLPPDALSRLNRDAVSLLHEVRDASSHERVLVAGDIGPSGDAYLPSEALPEKVAAGYHRAQALVLADAGVDFLFAPTFPSVAEAAGVCEAMAVTGLPFVISWILGPDHRVLDGTALADAIDRIDGNVGARPAWHSLSCIHPTAGAAALGELRDASPGALSRLVEFKANGSPLRTDELIKLDHPTADPPDSWARLMADLYDPGSLRILGGCCGTDDHHMAALAGLLAASA
jgi:homocysteine S-methyltransferase